MNWEEIKNNLLKSMGLLKDVSGQNGNVKYWYQVKTNLPTFSKDTINVTTLSPEGQTNIDNLSKPSLKKSNWMEYVYEEENPEGKWLSAPRDFSSESELLKSRDKVREVIKEEKCGGKVSKKQEGSKIENLLNDENFKARLEACGGKMKKKK